MLVDFIPFFAILDDRNFHTLRLEFITLLHLTCRGEYGIWAAFLALLTRLFFSFPGSYSSSSRLGYRLLNSSVGFFLVQLPFTRKEIGMKLMLIFDVRG
jgi:hypothetical protein